MKMSETRLGTILSLVLFLTTFFGVLFFMGFTLMGVQDTPSFVVAIFLAFATFIAVKACRTAASVAASRSEAAEPRTWKWGGTLLAAILLLPLYLEALFG